MHSFVGIALILIRIYSISYYYCTVLLEAQTDCYSYGVYTKYCQSLHFTVLHMLLLVDQILLHIYERGERGRGAKEVGMDLKTTTLTLSLSLKFYFYFILLDKNKIM